MTAETTAITPTTEKIVIFFLGIDDRGLPGGAADGLTFFLGGN
jgi:hypothetical protein